MFYKGEQGYIAPPTVAGPDQTAVLDMAPAGEARVMDVAPPLLAVWARVVTVPCTAPSMLERIHDGVSGGKTPLYSPGRVLLEGSETLKPHAMTHHIDLIFEGIEGEGAYWTDDHPLLRALKWRAGDRLWRKTFDVQLHDVCLRTRMQETARAPVMVADGTEAGALPLYAYGGFVPPRGQIDQAEPVFAFPAWDATCGKPVTALKLYRQSFLESRGGFAPNPFHMDQKKWVFQNPQPAPRYQTLGEDLVSGALTLKPEMQGGQVTYQSRAYQLWGGDAPPH